MSIEQEAFTEFAEEAAPAAPDLTAATDAPEQEKKISFDFLFQKTGPGSIDEYIDHPLNMGRSKGVAQIIRGFTGILGALDLAIVDIFLGVLQTIKEKKTADPQAEKWHYITDDESN